MKYKALLLTLLLTLFWNNGLVYSDPGDIVLWEPADLTLQAVMRLCSENNVYHADVEGYDGELITSAPGNGCGHTSSWRLGRDQIGYIRLRKIGVTMEEIDDALSVAYSLDCKYDWVGYYFLWTKYIMECVTKRDMIAEMPVLWPHYHCLSFTAACWRFDNPHDTLPDDMINHPDWEIIDENT